MCWCMDKRAVGWEVSSRTDKWWKNSAILYNTSNLTSPTFTIGRHWQRLHSDRAKRGMSGNIAGLVPKPFPQPLVCHQSACLFTFTKLLVAFSCWAKEDGCRHLFPLLVGQIWCVCNYAMLKPGIKQRCMVLLKRFSLIGNRKWCCRKIKLADSFPEAGDKTHC